MIVLAGGVGLFATNTYVTTSLMPSAIDDIGGVELYAWTMTVFVVAAVVSSMLVARSLALLGSRTSYVGGFAVFAGGTAIAAIAPTMPVMLVGRGIQGLAAGLLAGLGFAVVRLVLPRSLWQRAVALMSAMWGVGNLSGPLIGGVFAQVGLWRGAFVMLAGIAVLLGWLSARVLPPRAGAAEAVEPIPWTALALLAVAALAISVASIETDPIMVAVMMGGAVVAAGAFVLRERTAQVRVLPSLVYHGSSPLRWIYLSILLLTLAVTIETFIPLFGQELGGMSPLMAGFYGAAISWGWTVSAVISSNVASARGKRIVRVLGPLFISAGFLSLGLLQTDSAPWPVILGWVVSLFVAGCGIGMAMAHWLTAGLQVASGPGTGEAAQVSAGMNTTQLIATAFGSALAGLLVAVGGPSLLGSARVLSFSYVLVGVLAVGAALREFAVVRAMARGSGGAAGITPDRTNG
ncbi:putative drug resistance transporter [Gordonia hirsuta DSM 44140 = NBRC 16056]|uniref:Putative drug resistance transporter n=1 Tax=Gordonia hirsuta DSM 44140 = NBRC 16056 TaxID=1121927 RepID=L7L6Y8_9ACTN|nr:putative drug resistance transporter [Gordonia hirsuta DSM 44140 = NBRC 16056]